MIINTGKNLIVVIKLKNIYIICSKETKGRHDKINLLFVLITSDVHINLETTI